MKDRSTSLLTKGPITRSILMYTGPLILGNLFQQLYNTADSFIVGNFVNSIALAAVGASAPIISLFLGFIIGVTSGAGIVIAQYYGADNKVKLSLAVHTSFWFCILGGVFVSAAGFFLSPAVLQLMNTPADVITNAVLYLRIYFLGAFFAILYNMGAGILQAVGDTRHPLYYLALSSILNILLDLVFVVIFHLAVLGVSLATLIAQIVSALCVIVRLCRTDDIYRLVPSKIRYNKGMLIKILKAGIPTGLQTAITSLSNVIVQSYLNTFGYYAMAGSNIYGRLDSLALLPANCLALTTTTYIAQNLGARKFDRIKKAFSVFMWLGNSYAILLGIFLCFFSKIPLRLFTDNPEVIHYGVMMGRVLGPGYLLLITCQILIGTARGTGDTFPTMLLSIINLCGLRIIWLTIMLDRFPSIYTLYLGYPLTWGSAALCMAIYYQKRIKPRLIIKQSA
jgi:putative efflux protein, MATE family